MQRNADPLYMIFEQHLFNALVEAEETEAFLARVVGDYLGRVSQMGAIIPRDQREAIETDLKEEVLAMLRKKTYGHFDLNAYRQAKGIEVRSFPADHVAEEKEKARRSRRAC